MLNEGRTYRRPNDKLILTANPENMQFGEWEIVEIIGEGSSAVCYSGIHLGKVGRLKEYNPINPEKNGIENFISAYKILDNIKCSNSNFEIINNYVPHYEILYECESSGDIKSAFIWTPDDKKGTTFDTYIKDISADTSIKPEKKLIDILSVIETLSDCICVIHMAGLLHLDIKPSNFLVTYNSRREINAGNISLFDINTLYSIESDFSNVVGTEGYCAPEVGLGCPDNRADIYSIGAMLFSAIMKFGQTEYRVYKDSMYTNLREIINTSGLISGSEVNSTPEAVDKLVHIFEKSLSADRNRRYDYCEQLEEDLKALIELLKKKTYGEKIDVERLIKETTRRKHVEYIVIAAAFVISVAAIVLAIVVGMNSNKQETVPESVSAIEEVSVSLSASVDLTESIDSVTETEEPVEATVWATPEEAFDKMIELINSANTSVKRTEKHVLISPETVGNSEILFLHSFMIAGGTTVEFSDEMMFLFPDDFTWDFDAIDVAGTIILDTDRLLSKIGLYNGFAIVLKDKAMLVSNGMKFTAENLNDFFMWQCAGLVYEMKDNRFQKYWNIETELKVQGTYDQFVQEGFNYYYGVQEDGFKAIYFDGSNEPFDSVVSGNLEKLMHECLAGTADIYVDYPVVVKARQELVVPENCTIHLVAGGSIKVEPGSLINRWGTIIEEGGMLIE